jgi:signal transduction histidine kinase
MNQVRLKQQVQQAQEIELLGRMSRGMAHDLNNLLTPIWTLLQLSQEGVPPHEAGDLVEVALRNIKVMRSYIHESLFFAEHLRPNFKLGRLDALISQAAEIIGTRKRRHRVDVLFNSPGEVLVEMDEVLIQRLVLNIISNAIDASPQGASVRIEIERLGRRSGDVDWLRMRVVDSGKGIRPEDLERIYRPFFTTKDRGDETRGFGLGLAICRKIVELHHGTLHIASKPNEGTTVIADLPMRQVEPFTAARTNHQ